MQTKTETRSPLTPVFLPQRTEIQVAACDFYTHGLNVFPIPRFAKVPYQGIQLRQFYRHRLHHDPCDYQYDKEPPQFDLIHVTRGLCNLAIMLGKTSGNAFALDCDDRDTYQRVKDAVRELNVGLWCWTTRRGGHVPLRCTAGTLPNMKFPGFELRCDNQYIVVPESKFRDEHGEIHSYAWDERTCDSVPEVTPEQLQAILARLGHVVTVEVKQSGKRKSNSTSPLYLSTLDYLANGHTFPEGTRNDRLYQAAVDMAANGYTYERTYEMLAPIALQSGEIQRKVSSTIQSAFSKPRTSYKQVDNPRHPHVDMAYRFVQEYTWHGRSASTDRMVFLALLQCAARGMGKHGVYRGTIREIMELARLNSYHTILKSLKRMVDANMIVDARGTDTHGYHTRRYYHTNKHGDVIERQWNTSQRLWRFGDRVLHTPPCQKCNTYPIRFWENTVALSAGSDATERQALGLSGTLIYRTLLDSDSGHTTRQLNEITGFTLSQVRRAVDRLSQYALVTYKLIERNAKLWFGVPKTLDELQREVAIPTGAADAARARRTRLQRERGLYLGALLYDARLRHDRDRLLRPEDGFYYTEGHKPKLDRVRREN